MEILQQQTCRLCCYLHYYLLYMCIFTAVSPTYFSGGTFQDHTISLNICRRKTHCVSTWIVCNVTEYSKNTLVKICFIECLYRNTRSMVHHVKKGKKNKQLPGIEPRVPNLSYQCSVWADGCMVVILWWPVYSQLKPGIPHWFNSHWLPCRVFTFH